MNSKSQYEAKLRFWGYKKNLSCKEWETHFARANGLEATSDLVTTAGCVKKGKKVDRGKRYLQEIKRAQVKEPCQPTASTSVENPQRAPMPISERVQHNLAELQSSSCLTLDNSLMESTSFSAWLCDNVSLSLPGLLNPIPSYSPQAPSSGPSWMGANTSPPTWNTAQQFALSTSEAIFNNIISSGSQDTAMQPQPDDWGVENIFSGDFGLPDANDLEIGAFSPFLAPENHLGSDQTPSAINDFVLHSSSAMQSRGPLVGRAFSPGFRREWLRTLPFVEFEAFLSAKGMALTSKPGGDSGSFFSRSLVLVAVLNKLYDLDGTMTQNIPWVQTSFRILASLVPGTAGAIISKQQMTESSIMRMLLYSMMNGFAGLNDIPIERFLPCLRRLKFFDTSFLEILRKAPSYTWRTFVDNLFRVSIEAKDEKIVQLLLESGLVDFDNTVCFDGGRRYTPTERAASLHAFKIVRILIEYGADIKKTYEDSEFDPHGITGPHGVLPCLLYDGFFSNWSRDPSPELFATLQFLIEKGSKMSVRGLIYIGNRLTTHEVGCLMSRAVSIADHRAFFQPHESHSEAMSPVIQTATMFNPETSASIMGKMIEICKSHCGSCLVEFPEIMEAAAVAGAIRGRLPVVKLLIDYAKSTDLILSAAIRSGNSDLIQFLLRRNPSLNAPARYLRSNQSMDDIGWGQTEILTTPLAEAVRAGNEEMIRHFEAAGCGAPTSLTDHGRLEAAILGAVEAGNISYLRRLLPIASSTKVEFRIPGFALTLALKCGHEEVAYLLIGEGALGTEALQIALHKRNSKMVAAILATDISGHSIGGRLHGSEWCESSMLKYSLFMIKMGRTDSSTLASVCMDCMETNNLDPFRRLMESASISDEDLDRLLAMAIQKDHRTMARYMLERGANPSSPKALAAAIPHRLEMLLFLFGTDVQERPVVRSFKKCIGAELLQVLMSGDKENAKVLDQLLEYGAVNLNILEEVDAPGWSLIGLATPLGIAISSTSESCSPYVSAIRKFVQAGADPNACARFEEDTNLCFTALMVALETGREDIVTLLIQEGADVNLEPRLGLKRTPLQYAAELGDLDMIQLLLRKGADVNGPPAFQGGGTALQFAAISGNCNIAAKLLERGASLDIPPSKLDGRWPVEGAAEHGRLDMVQLLWNARELSPGGAGFEKRQCLRAMYFAQENGHVGCRDLVAKLSELPVELLETEEYGVPWLSY